jgi:hypothetical protein
MLTADEDTTPFIVNRTYDSKAWEILRDVAERNGFIWALDYRDGWVVDFTQPGQRTGDAGAGVVSFEATKDSGAINRKAVVFGGANQTRADSFVANHGTAVSLSSGQIIPGSEAIYDPSTGQQFSQGTDYELWPAEGNIVTLAAGDMADGQTYNADYRHNAYGEYEAPSHDGDPVYETTQTIPALADDREAEQAARRIVEQTNSPLWRVSVEVDREPAGFSLVDSIDWENLPDVDTAFEVWNVDSSPRSIELELGSRPTEREVVENIASGLVEASRRS